MAPQKYSSSTFKNWKRPQETNRTSDRTAGAQSELESEKDMVRSMLSESLVAVVSQTLLKTKDGQGRVAAHEIMIGTPAIRNLIRENKVAQMYSAIQTSQAIGMQTLDQHLTELVKRNQINMVEARMRAVNKELFGG